MELKKKIQNPPKAIRSNLAYYASIVANLATFGSSVVSAFFLNVYYDTITNKNNNNWDAETRKNNLSALSLCYNLGGLSGLLLSFMVYRLNPRLVLNLSRVAISVSYLFLAIPNIYVMLVSRFLANLFSVIAQITIRWTVYELYLDKDQSKVMVALTLSAPASDLLISIRSKFDPGDALYWRLALGILPSLLILSLLLDLFCSRGLNSVTYLLKQKGRQRALEQLKQVFFDEYTEALVEKIDKQIKAEEREKLRLSEKGVSQWGMDLAIYESSFTSLMMVCFLGTFGFQMQYVSNGLIIGSKYLDDFASTRRTKTALFLQTILELICYILVLMLNLAKKRKTSILISIVVAFLVLTSSCVGYLFNNLDIVRLGMIGLAPSFPFFFPAIHLYANDLVPPSLLPWQPVFYYVIDSVADSAMPFLFDFEETTHKSIGIKFGLLAALCLVSLVLINFLMIETEGMTREELRVIHDRRWGSGSKGGYVELGKNEMIGETPRTKDPLEG